MSDHANVSREAEVDRQFRLVQGMRAIIYTQTDPTADKDLHKRLTQEEAKLHNLEQLREVPFSLANTLPPPQARAHLLGPETTGLQVETKLLMQPLPTGVYHLLDPKIEPLFTVTVVNKSNEKKRVRVTAFLEGLSAQSVRTVELLKRDDKEDFKMLPTLLPKAAHAVTEIQWATLHIIVDDLGFRREEEPTAARPQQESHNTFPILCLARTSSFNSVRRPDTGQVVDLTHYYGAWVTPYAESVQERIRRAAELSSSGMIWGYQKDLNSVTDQVGVLYQALQEAGITYVNSVIDYGAAAGQSTQRTRLPREALAQRSANCIDGTVLMASLLEGASLNPALVIVPGHAFVGWETWHGSNEWRFLETTLIGKSPFATACQVGQHQYEDHKQSNSDRMKFHPLSRLRARGIWPME